MALTHESWLTAARAEQQLNSAPICFRIGEVARVHNSERHLFTLRYNPRELRQDSKAHREVRMGEALIGCNIRHVSRDRSEWTGTVRYADTDRNELVIQHHTGRPPAAVDAVELYPVLWLDPLIQWLEAKVRDPITAPLLGRLHPRTRTGIPQSLGDRDRVYPTLRSAQLDAIKLVNYPLSVVWGPPGTGKTYTLAYLAAKLKTYDRRLLILCPTKVAADNACLACDSAFDATGIDRVRGDVLRTDLPELYDQFQRRGNHLLVWSELEQGYKTEVGNLKKRIEELSSALSSALDPERNDLIVELDEARHRVDEAKAHYRQRQQALINNAAVVCATIRQDQSRDMSGDFRYVTIDEAGMVSVSDGLSILHRTEGRVLFAGDHKQLGPISKAASSNRGGDQSAATQDAAKQWLGRSILNLLMEDHRDGCPVVMLNQQSRMNETLCRVVSATMYGGALSAIDPPPEGLPPRLPSGLCVLNTAAKPEWLPPPVKQGRQNSVRNSNIESAQAAVSLARHIVAEGASVVISSPYSAQANLLKRGVADLHAHCRAGTVHKLQGTEADVSIYDPTIPGSWFPSRSPEAGRILNVAASRAKRVFVLCNDLQKMYENRLLVPYLEAATVIGTQADGPQTTVSVDSSGEHDTGKSRNS